VSDFRRQFMLLIVTSALLLCRLSTELEGQKQANIILAFEHRQLSMQSMPTREGAIELDQLRVSHRHSQAELAAKSEQIEALSEEIEVLAARVKDVPARLTMEAETRAPHVSLQWVEQTLMGIRGEVERLLDNATVQGPGNGADGWGRQSSLSESAVKKNMEFVNRRIEMAGAEARKNGSHHTHRTTHIAPHTSPTPSSTVVLEH
jgi:hypothetical protein